MENEDKKLPNSILNWEELLSNRTKFKLYAAKQHLKNLKDIENTCNSLVSSPEIRIQTEIALDCFLNSLIGAKESLLFTINRKLKLCLPSTNVHLKGVNCELYKIKKTKLLCKLTYLTNDESSWLSLLNELRNHSHHRTNISRDIRIDAGRQTLPEVYLIDPREQRLSEEEKIRKKRNEFKDYLKNNNYYSKHLTHSELTEIFNDFLEKRERNKKEKMISALEKLYLNMEELINEILISLNKL